MDKHSFHRKIITRKDIQLILGKSERSARELMQRLRVHLRKRPEQYVSVSEFCEFVGLKEAEVVEFFRI